MDRCGHIAPSTVFDLVGGLSELSIPPRGGMDTRCRHRPLCADYWKEYSTVTQLADPSGPTDRPHYIYALVDANGRVRYVGKTYDVRGRLVGHRRMARYTARASPVYAWLRGVEAPPTAVILQTVSADDAARAEREWILRMRSIADPTAPLLNIRPGLPTALRGKPKTREHRDAIAAAVQRYYDGHPRLSVICAGCGREFHGEKGLTSHRTRPTTVGACRDGVDRLAVAA